MEVKTGCFSSINWNECKKLDLNRPSPLEVRQDLPIINKTERRYTYFPSEFLHTSMTLKFIYCMYKSCSGTILLHTLQCVIYLFHIVTTYFFQNKKLTVSSARSQYFFYFEINRIETYLK